MYFILEVKIIYIGIDSLNIWCFESFSWVMTVNKNQETDTSSSKVMVYLNCLLLHWTKLTFSNLFLQWMTLWIANFSASKVHTVIRLQRGESKMKATHFTSQLGEERHLIYWIIVGISPRVILYLIEMATAQISSSLFYITNW